MSDEPKQPPQDRPGEAEAGEPLPEPGFRSFVSGLAGQTLIQLGLVEDPTTGRRKQQLDQAKYTIDLLKLISDKTQGNLTADERKLIDGFLYELRMRYVEAQKHSASGD